MVGGSVILDFWPADLRREKRKSKIDLRRETSSFPSPFLQMAEMAALESDLEALAAGADESGSDDDGGEGPRMDFKKRFSKSFNIGFLNQLKSELDAEQAGDGGSGSDDDGDPNYGEEDETPAVRNRARASPPESFARLLTPFKPPPAPVEVG